MWTIKQSEILEARTALRYYHGDQWTKEQLDTLQARGQPAITFNRVGRKIDGLVGVLEKLRGDPKAVGRVENDEQGAELSTQCIRYALDLSRFAAQETEALRKGACTGIVIAELGIVQGDKLDPDIDLATVDATTFFYDPRSLKLDFSDARYMGVSKLMTQDEFEELFPGKWDDALSSIDDTGETEFDLDRSYLWSQGRTGCASSSIGIAPRANGASPSTPAPSCCEPGSRPSSTRRARPSRATTPSRCMSMGSAIITASCAT